jgi:hypothetical protein
MCVMSNATVTFKQNSRHTGNNCMHFLLQSENKQVKPEVILHPTNCKQCRTNDAYIYHLPAVRTKVKLEVAAFYGYQL